MKLKDLRQTFIAALSNTYPVEEIQSFFTILAEKHFKLSRLEIALDPDQFISEKQSNKIHDAIQRLKLYEPIQYIIGETEFCGLKFAVNESVLIPRSETEELISWIVEDHRDSEKEVLHILDIGTGSGCIAISLANKLPNSNVSANDLSPSALIMARQNAKANETKITFLKDDILNCNKLPRRYDIIVSNPPYVTENEKGQLQPNVLEFEPHDALFVSNEDPLLFYRKIIELSKLYLKTNGILYFEINEYLSSDLLALFKTEGLTHVTLHKDIYGKDRMVKCKYDE